MVTNYRPGSQRVCVQFFRDQSTLLESLATYNCAILVVGDVNLRLQQPTDPDTQRFGQPIDGSEMRQYVQELTHKRGGLLDVVIASEATAPEDLTVVESGLSDHKLIHWLTSIS